MKIIFAPTKLFNENAEYTDQGTLFESITNEIVEDIKNMSKSNLQIKYKLSDALTDTVFNYYQNFDKNQRHIAFDFYLGESFKSFNYSTLGSKERNFLQKNVFIIDALYGIISPLDGIKPYRMDFTNKKMKPIWKTEVNKFFESQATDTILSLASKEFTDLIDYKNFNLFEVSFIDCIEGVCKKVSVFNKQMRGTLLRYIVDHKIIKINDLPDSILDYKKHLKSNTIEYIKIH
jgi:cytoplasmic iron level regulating protein YaaA (DUF328/UPF0246 family)